MCRLKAGHVYALVGPGDRMPGGEDQLSDATNATARQSRPGRPRNDAERNARVVRGAVSGVRGADPTLRASMALRATRAL